MHNKWSCRKNQTILFFQMLCFSGLGQNSLSWNVRSEHTQYNLATTSDLCCQPHCTSNILLKREFRTIPIRTSVWASYSSDVPGFRQVKIILQLRQLFIAPCSQPTIVAPLNMLSNIINHIEFVASGKIYWLNNILCYNDITREFEFSG